MKTILVVEDDTEVRVLLVRVLRDAGYQTLAAEDGTMALRVARNQHPDMILLDLNLPAGNGQFVLDSVTNSVELCGTPVVVLSGDPHLNEEDLKHRGAVAAFRKPVDQQVFLQSIAGIFDSSSVVEA
ncbi:MAG: response regulator [Verrucomicrobiae bacterium]|jgi:two-component system cell cycle response regulator DivK|nr:response regulator [Verrucomicrobiae bacterium]